jgi:hypothetical protein
MALNLWKLGGQPTAYSPLPVATQTIIGLTPYQEYIIKFKARSASNARLNISSLVNTSFDFTSDLKEYTHPFICGSTGILYVNDINDKGDIIIQDIQLVEKPLPKLTINGVDGFLSGKWSKPPYATFIDDETLQFNVSSNGLSYLDLILEVGQTYSFNCQVDYGKFSIYRLNGGALNGALMPYRNTPGTFVADTSTVRLFLSSEGANGLMTFKKPMLNLGSTPAPYSKKTGERMWMPVKPRVKVARKNLFDGKYDEGYIQSINETLLDGHLGYKTTKWMDCKSNTDYVASGYPRPTVRWQVKNSSGVISLIDNTSSIKTLSDTVKMRCTYKGSTPGDDTQFQIEQGSTPTPYEPYTEIIPPARKGLVMDGVTNYLQLPSMMMDSVEIDCLIDSSNTSSMLIDGRGGVVNGYMYHSGFLGSGFAKKFINGVDGAAMKFNERIKVKISSNTFADDITIFGNQSGVERLKGILYGVKCFLNGQVVAAYDFTNPKNIIGDKVLQSAKNLIPGFSDPRWSFHPNFKVLGNDMGRLDAIGGYNVSKITLKTKPNSNYLCALVSRDAGRLRIGKDDGTINGEWLTETNNTINKTRNFSIPSDVTGIICTLDNNGGVNGSFDFIKPQLYELDGKEGTLYGSPVSELKAPKRVLYAKR